MRVYFATIPNCTYLAGAPDPYVGALPLPELFSLLRSCSRRRAKFKGEVGEKLNFPSVGKGIEVVSFDAETFVRIIGNLGSDTVVHDFKTVQG